MFRRVDRITPSRSNRNATHPRRRALVARLVAFSLLACLGLSIAISWPEEDAQVSFAASPPEIDPAQISVSEPKTGRIVEVKIAASAITDGTGTDVRVYNLTTGEWTAAVPFDPALGTTVNATGSGGDLLELEAVNAGGSDVELLGYIPDPSDVARPEIDAGRIGKTWNGSTLTLTYLSSGAIDDESFPVLLELFVDGNPGGVATDTVVSRNDPFQLLVGANPDDRLILRVTDDYGNRTEMHYVATSSGPAAAAGLGSFVPSPTQTPSERTGHAPVGGKNVLLHGLEFVFNLDLWEIPGAVASVQFPLSYRSGLDYDGPVGKGWDFGLDSRIEKLPSGERCWVTGHGRVEESFPVVVPKVEWDSPAGIFRKLTYVSQSLEYRLEDRFGNAMVFSGKQALLERIEDAYGNTVTLVRNGEDQVVEVQDDLGRRISLSWFDTGRLAEIRDFNGRTVQCSYNSDGCLTAVQRPDGTSVTFEYNSGVANMPHLLTAFKDAAGKAAIVNDYNSSGEIKFQNDLYSIDSSGKYSFSRILNGSQVVGTKVIDPAGAEVNYSYDPTSTNVLLDAIEWRSNLDMRGGTLPTYPGADDPDGWRDRFTYDFNLLRAEVVHDIVHDSMADVVDLEGEQWTYAFSLEPQFRDRVATHTQLGDYTDPNDDLTETWTYTVSAATPSSYTGLRGETVQFSHDAGGQLLSREQTGLARTGAPNTYDIKQTYTYDSRGRIASETGPNRWEDDPVSPEPDRKFTYYADNVLTEGFDAGRPATIQLVDENGVTQHTTTLHWDSVGNLLSRTDPGGATYTWEYDDNDRRVRMLEPVVTLANQATVQGEVVWDYSTDGYLDAVRTRNWNADGSAGSPAWAESRLEYDTYGRLVANEADRSATRDTRVEYVYGPRGELLREAARISATEWAISETVYDARGEVVASTQDPTKHSTSSATLSAAAITTWYQFDLRGRESERHEPLSNGPVTSIYDQYGRRIATETSEVDLGEAYEGMPQQWTSRSGYVRWETDWTDASDVAAVRRMSRLTTAHPWAVISETRYFHDAAGRNIGFLAAKEWNPDDPATTPSDWVTWNTDLYADGTTWREYTPDQGGINVYTLDDLGRLASKSDQYGNTTLYTYDGTTGYLLHKDEEPINEAILAMPSPQPPQPSYRTTYLYDELGRQTGYDFIGNVNASPAPPTVGERYQFNSLGHLIQASKFNATSQLTGMITKYTPDLLGSVENVRIGKSFSSYVDYQEASMVVDELGRVTSVTQNPQAPGGSSSLPARVTTRTLDALGRVTAETLPPQQMTSGARSYTYEPNGFRLATMIDERGVELAYTFNDLGQLLQTDVDLTGAPVHVAGATAVHYRYGMLRDDPASAGTIFVAGGESQVATTFSNGLFQTIVSRQYDAQDNLLSESIQVPSGCATANILETSFGYDDVGHRTQVNYPGQDGAVMHREYRIDGVLERTLVETLNASQQIVNRTIETRLHEGEKVIEVNGFEPNPFLADEADLLFTRRTDLNGHGMPTAMYLSLTSENLTDVLFDEFQYNWEGLVVRKYQYAEDQWTHIRYDSQNRMIDALWGSDSDQAPTNWSSIPTSAGGSYIHRTQSWNLFGEVSAVTEEWKERNTTTSVIFQRDNAGYITGHAANPNNEQWTHLLDGADALSKMEDLLRTPDATNWSPTTSYDYFKKYDCSGNGSGPDYEENTHVVQGTVVDAWGHEVYKTHTRSQILNETNIDCSLDPILGEQYSVSSLWDGYGRKVYYDLDGGGDPREVMLAYELSDQISAVRLEDDGCGVSVRKVEWHLPQGMPRRAFMPNNDPCGPSGSGGGPEFSFGHWMIPDLSGNAVLSSRPADGGIPATEDDEWNTVSYTPWNTVAETSFSEHYLIPAHGVGNWLVGMDGGPHECAMIPEQPIASCMIAGPDQPYLSNQSSGTASNGGGSGEADAQELCLPEDDDPCDKFGIESAKRTLEAQRKSLSRAKDKQSEASNKVDETSTWNPRFRGRHTAWLKAVAKVAEREVAVMKVYELLISRLATCLHKGPHILDEMRRAESKAWVHAQNAQAAADLVDSQSNQTWRKAQGIAFSVAINAAIAAATLGIGNAINGARAAASTGRAVTAGRTTAAASKGRTNAQLVQDVATRAEAAVGGTGARAGTLKHSYAKRMIDKYQGIYGSRGLVTESSWIARTPVRYGAKGSTRIDVLDMGARTAYDFKFTIRPPGLSASQVNRILQNGPAGLQRVLPVNP